MFYYLITACFRIFFKLLFRYQIYGWENIPEKGAYIICSNHKSWFDPPLVGSVCRHACINFMAKEELFHIFLFGSIIRKLGAFPVKRDTADRRALKKALQLLEEGKIIGLFPEGTRVKGGELGQPFHGPALIALLSKKPVLPVAVKWPGKLFQPVRITFGNLLYFEEEGKIRKDILERVSARIIGEIGLLFKSS
ncbi:MAG: lysophospholipid acyltransferase family protein [Bacillota bacterium]